MSNYHQLEVRYNDLLINFLKTNAWSSHANYLRKLIKTGFVSSIRISENGKVTNYVPLSEVKRLDKVILKMLRDNTLFDVEQLEAEFAKIGDFFISLSSVDFSIISDKELISHYSGYCKNFGTLAGSLYIIFRLDDLMTEPLGELKRYIEAGAADKRLIDEWIRALTLPEKESYITREEREFLEIALTVKNPARPAKEKLKLLKKHSEKYCWIPVQQDEKPWDIEHYLELLKNLDFKSGKARLEELKSNIPKLNSERKEILLKLKPNRRIHNIIKNFQDISHLRDLRKIAYSKARFYSRQMFEAMAKRLNIKVTEVGYLTPDETISLLLKGAISKKG